jgi:hypothetical protein
LRETSTLVDEVDEFSTELRRAARTLKNNGRGAQQSAKHGGSNHSAKVAAKLREYFDEFSGERRTGGGRKSIADCYHGKVIRAIKDVDGSAKSLNVTIDLTVLTSHHAFLFEAKASADTRSVYTAIGQLAVHAPRVSEIASGLPLVKVIVVPEPPSKHFRSVIEGELGINLLTFTRSAQPSLSTASKNFKMYDQA